ncbi:Mis12-domain-containing protein [Coniophora puteana RWD-64-598 SS2]|uniref:Mis12-domain-containing protein n=1 Tax=Coniophora puteana (strain RWD-64-598) TaxID=741705 RepID=A0A5M3N283_CONPW|nr:Mis12-domain-containing protein [Coniophora puteana RWD-64-598 SS2]EIW85478.1 Mis12-domain-containing protein [Coniophora puteana RWD-64-598 SS2]
MANPSASAPPPSVPSVLLPEILAFSPQLLLDDVINYANDAITTNVDGMEEFLTRWAQNRTKKPGEEWDSTQEVEKGLVAYQTLLESHTDIAFDFFETWSLRNIFAVPPDLPIVVPHQEGLDLSCPPEREVELMTEIEELRKKIDAQRKLKRLLKRAARKAKAQRRRSEHVLSELAFLQSPHMQELADLPAQFESMYNSVSTLPPLTDEYIATFTSTPVADPGKRDWETSKAGYQEWAVKQLLAKARQQDIAAGKRSMAVDAVVEDTAAIANAGHLRAALDALTASSRRPRQDDAMDI